MVGKEFELLSKSKLKLIRFFLTDYGSPQSGYTCTVYSFSNRKTPDIKIYDHPVICSSTTVNEWIELPLESEKTIFSPGRYLIAIKWQDSPGEEGKNSIAVGFQESDERPVSWMNWHGNDSQWQKDTGPYRGNFMIEPVLEMKELEE